MSNDSRRRSRGILSIRPVSTLKPPRKPFWNQVNNNLVALISLVLAISSLGYNTWRNEKTEMQRNWRQASFQILVEVGELNQIILLRRYFSETNSSDADTDAGGIHDPNRWVSGWGKVTMIRDLSSVMPEPMPTAGRNLFETWQQQAGNLDHQNEPDVRQQAADELLDAVEGLRSKTVTLISELT